MTVTFHNVTVTIEAASAKDAYDALCELLNRYNERHAGGVEWETDTFSVGDGDARDTSELWPK